jgi:hypothetical protein
MLNRRQFLQAILAAGCAPAIVRASSLMPIVAIKEQTILFPKFERGEKPLMFYTFNPTADNWLQRVWIDETQKIVDETCGLPNRWQAITKNVNSYGRVKICRA